jgi:hypothetical protein
MKKNGIVFSLVCLAVRALALTHHALLPSKTVARFERKDEIKKYLLLQNHKSTKKVPTLRDKI